MLLSESKRQVVPARGGKGSRVIGGKSCVGTWSRRGSDAERREREGMFLWIALRR